jgi:hypothetical protein
MDVYAPEQTTTAAMKISVWTLHMRHIAHRPDQRASVLLIERRLTLLVRQPSAGFGNLGAHLEHDPLDGAPDRKITTWRTPRRHARQCGQGDASDLVD